MSNDKVQSIMALVDDSPFTEFDYLLNRYTAAAQHEKPATQGFKGHHDALYAYVRDLERRAIAAPGVAIEPTQQMLIAARDWSHRVYGKPIGNEAATGCWQVMLYAALAPSPTAEQPTPPATSVDEAARSLAKWLNERPNRPINLEDVAMLVHYVQMEDASDDRAWNAE